MQASSSVPPNGYVPDGRTAIAIAEAVLVPIYGDKAVLDERPFHANLEGETWVISGTLAKNALGGVATVKLSKKDGRIVAIMHSR